MRTDVRRAGRPAAARRRPNPGHQGTRTPPRGPIRPTLHLLLLLLGVLTSCLVAGGSQAHAEPVPTPPPPAPAPGPDSPCAAKANGKSYWCMDWAIKVTDKPEGAPSHWQTVCSKASESDRPACEAASLTLASPAPDNTPSILLDGPPVNGNRAAMVGCDTFTKRAESDPANAAAWNDKHGRCQQFIGFYVSQLFEPPTLPVQGPIPEEQCGSVDIVCKVGKGVKEAIANGIAFGVQGIVDLVVQAMVTLIGKLAELIFNSTSISAPDNAFHFAYNSMAGFMVLLVFIFFLISTIINGLRINGPGPLSSIGGLVRAILGITFAGGIAYVIVYAWDEATAALIRHNSDRPWNPAGWIQAITGLSHGVGTMFLALLVAVFAVFGLVLLFIMMLFRGVLTTAAALFGAMAMTGQVMPETRHWGRRWFWTINALASSKFFIAALWIYGSRAAYESDLATSLKALLLIWVMVMAPFVMLRLTTMWDGYLSDVNARGVLSAVADGIGTGSSDSASSSSSGGSGGAGGSAPALMNANSAGIATTPGDDMTQASGGHKDPGRDAADAVGTGQDGEPVGDVSGPAETAEHDGEGDTSNADNAEGDRDGTDAARADLDSGELQAPGDATGDSATPPVAGSDEPDPSSGEDTGASLGDGTAGAGDPDPHATGAGAASDPSAASSDTDSADTGATPAGVDPAIDGSGAPEPAAVEDPQPQPAGSESEPYASETSSGAAGSRGATSSAEGGFSSAATAAADSPIVPLPKDG